MRRRGGTGHLWGGPCHIELEDSLLTSLDSPWLLAGTARESASRSGCVGGEMSHGLDGSCPVRFIVQSGGMMMHWGLASGFLELFGSSSPKQRVLGIQGWNFAFPS